MSFNVGNKVTVIFDGTIEEQIPSHNGVNRYKVKADGDDAYFVVFEYQIKKQSIKYKLLHKLFNIKKEIKLC